ncbi:MAG: LSM domain-containing protein [Halobacteriota archaeon]
MSGRPLDVLEEALDQTVTVRLKDGDTFAGVLAGYDQHMNVVLDPADGSSDDGSLGVVAVESIEDTTIIRGDNVVSITV